MVFRTLLKWHDISFMKTWRKCSCYMTDRYRFFKFGLLSHASSYNVFGTSRMIFLLIMFLQRYSWWYSWSGYNRVQCRTERNSNLSNQRCQPPLFDALPNVNSSAGRASRVVLANTALMCHQLADSWRRERGRPSPSTGSCFSQRTYPPLHQ